VRKKTDVNCHDAQNLIHAYHDSELDLANSLAVEEHLRECPACAAVLERQRALRAAIHAGSLSYPAPSDLRGRIRSAVRRASGAPAVHRAPAWPWLGVAAAAAALFFLAGSTALFLVALRRPSVDDRLSHEVVSRYVYDVMPEHPLDVPSSNSHEVKPWFGPRLDFAPPVIDLSDNDFPLVGGRLEYLNDRKVAGLVYHRHKHVINLFVWPAPGEPDTAPAALTRQGYHLVHWNKSGMTFWAVSDLNAAELQQFAELIRSHLD
jgi:anti-sigma factor RsiW